MRSLNGSATKSALALGIGLAAAPAPCETPARIWQGVERVNVSCLLHGENGVDSGPLHARICDHVRAAAAQGAPVPVALVGAGDPSILAPGSLTLLVHGWTRPADGGRILAISVRPYRNLGSEEPGLLFAAPPRAVLIRQGDARALEAMLNESITETLPWQAPSPARQIR